jgi:hypothetical protein
MAFAMKTQTKRKLKGAKFEYEMEMEGEKGDRGCANLSGFSMHANVCIPAKARHQLENLCRYVARPAVATERLSRFPDGRVLYRPRHRWRDGTSHVIFDPVDLIGKLAALAPPPRFNLVGANLVFARIHRWRSRIVPITLSEETGSPDCITCADNKGNKNGQKQMSGRAMNYSWAELMKRVFDLDNN